MKKLSPILVFALLLFVLAGCGGSTQPTERAAEPTGTVAAATEAATETSVAETTQAPTAAQISENEKKYTMDCGAAITAEYGLLEVAMSPFTTTLQGDNIMIALLDENKAVTGAQDLTLDDYAYLVSVGNNFPDPFALDADGNLATSYTAEIDGASFFYYATVHETNSSFWLCQMVCPENMQADYESLFSRWSATLTLSDTEATVIDASQEETYQLSCGMEVTMTAGMMETQMEGYDAFVTNNQLVLALLKEEKPESWTLDDYAAAVSSANSIDAFEVNEAGVPAASFSAEVEGMNYFFYLTVHETEDAFWLCQFYTVEGMLDAYLPYLPAWSASLKPIA